MDIDIRNEDAKLLEELHYLSRNQLFLKEVKKLRQLHNIPIYGITGNVDAFYLHIWTKEQQQKFHQDFDPLLLRCVGGKSELQWRFGSIVRNYVLNNKLPYTLPKSMGGMTTPARWQKQGDKIALTFFLSFDTTKTQIKALVDDYWDELKELQTTIVKKRLKESPNFTTNLVLWEERMYKGKTLKELQDLPMIKITSNYTYDDIMKIIKRTDARIKASFR